MPPVLVSNSLEKMQVIDLVFPSLMQGISMPMA